MLRQPTPITAKMHVVMAEPTARLDFYECLRGAGKPCWFIRVGQQGAALSDICGSPRGAWKNAYNSLMASLKKKRGGN